MDKDMLFATIKEGVTKTAQSAVKKSNEIVEITKLRISIADGEAEVAKIMREIGEALYEAYKNDTTPAISLEEKCREADERIEMIESLREKLSAVKKMKRCPSCKKEADIDAAFCSNCGEHFEN